MKKRNTLERKTSLVMVGFIIAVFLLGWSLETGAAKKPMKEQQMEDIRKMANQTLSRLYKMQPSARQAIQGAAGYGVFSSFGMKIFVAGGGKGHGVVVDNATKKETFMKMLEIQAGLGMGIKKFRLIFVFENSTVLNDFIESGWQLGAQATAAAKTGGEGGSFAGAMSVSPGIWLYQLTDSCLALELTVMGTKYYKDDSLN